MLQSQQELANSSESDSTKQHSLPAQPSSEGVNVLLILLRLSTTCWLVRTNAVRTKNAVFYKILVALLLMIIAVFIHMTHKIDLHLSRLLNSLEFYFNYRI